MPLADDATARSALRASGLFGAADEAAIDALVRVLRIRRFRRGETVFHQGDPGDALFVIASGSVKVVLPRPSSTGRHTRPRSWPSSRPRSSSSTATPSSG
jgi:CRP-like cAMP-binding protein